MKQISGLVSRIDHFLTGSYLSVFLLFVFLISVSPAGSLAASANSEYLAYTSSTVIFGNEFNFFATPEKTSNLKAGTAEAVPTIEIERTSTPQAAATATRSIEKIPITVVTRQTAALKTISTQERQEHPDLPDLKTTAIPANSTASLTAMPTVEASPLGISTPSMTPAPVPGLSVSSAVAVTVVKDSLRENENAADQKESANETPASESTLQPMAIQDRNQTLTMTPTLYVPANVVRTPESDNVAILGYPTALETDKLIRFGQMGIDTFTMNGPYDSRSLSITAPPTWAMSGSAILVLNLTIIDTSSESSSRLTPTPSDQNLVPYISVSWNGEKVSTVSLPSLGEQKVVIEIPQKALRVNDFTNKSSLTLNFVSAKDCSLDSKTTLEVSADSSVEFSYDMRPYFMDLERNISQLNDRSSFVPIPSYFVIPDSLEIEDAKNILKFVSAFGAKNNATLNYTIKTYSEITDEMKAQGNFLFVGKTADYPVLSEVAFDVPVENGSFQKVDGSTPEDGVLQVAVSPWNPWRAVIFIGGDTQTAVDKAIGGYVSDEIRYLQLNSSAIVQDYTVSAVADTISKIETSFKDLGITDSINLVGTGTNTRSVYFSLPVGYSADAGSYVSFDITYPETYQVDASELRIYLNGERMSALTLDKANNYLEKHVILPSTAFRSGRNVLEIRSNLVQPDLCQTTVQSSPWVTISNESFLHIGLRKEAEETVTAMQSLSDFPEGLLTKDDSSNILWIFSYKDMEAYKTVMNLAAEIGMANYSGIFNIQAAFAESDLSAWTDVDWVVVGATEKIKPVLELANQYLPVQFNEDYSAALESEVLPSYILQNMDSFGYIELGLNPYNTTRSLLLLTGTDTEGMNSASYVFNRANRGRLNGTYASVADNQLLSHNSNILVVVTPTAVRTVATHTPASLPAVASSLDGKTKLVVYGVIGFNILVILSLLGYLIYKRRKARLEEKQRKKMTAFRIQESKQANTESDQEKK